MATQTVIVTGKKKLDKKLKRLRKRDANKANRSGVNAGLTIVAKGIRSVAPVGKTRTLKKSIGKRFGKKRKADLLEAKAGPNVGVTAKKERKRTDAGKSGKRAFHAHLVTLGTAKRRTDSGANRGRTRSNDFVTRGFRKTRRQAMRKQLAVTAAKIEKFGNAS